MRENMSTYQYYEFRTMDRVLSAEEQEELGKLSSRARITATRFVNSYSYGDFRGDPKRIMEKYFDLHLYYASWGTCQIMMRLPKCAVNRMDLVPFLREVDWVEIWEHGNDLIVDMCLNRDDYYYQYWEEDAGQVDAIAPIRAEIVSGDLRLFYLLWLASVEDGFLPDDEFEPLPGMGPLTDSLAACAEFFQIDSDLVLAAAERDIGRAAMSVDSMRAALTEIPDADKTELLFQLITDDPNVAARLKRRIGLHKSRESAPRRTVGELQALVPKIRKLRRDAEAERCEEERRRHAEKEEKARTARVAAVKSRGDSVWQEIDDEVSIPSGLHYDRAATLLFDLKSIAQERGTLAEFSARLNEVRNKHARKKKFLERLEKLGQH